ncbi:hypothetical protein [Bacillus sp. 3255]|uniref:hypothetical protein n=1 Tax=Bacillus sp. 3255 TaxID=2817904 RepID=UPI002858B058|nr:hypothetical protein [Bacillus sp. 3255]MDR6884015.1 hypothetical protein [Bacillus sp. 3255]
MANFRCSCGKVLSNSVSPNEVQLVIFSDGEWENIQEKVKEGADIFDFEPQFDVWRCPFCENIYYFKGKELIKSYVLKKE